MGRFSFTFHECSGTSAEVGKSLEVTDAEAAQEAAVQLARSIMADEVSQGRLCLSCWIVVRNGQGHHVFTLQFSDAVRMAGAAECVSHVASGHGGKSRA